VTALAAALAAGLALAGGAPGQAQAAPVRAPGSTSPSADSPPPPADPDRLTFPPSQDRPPPGHVRSADDVLAIADRNPKAVETLRRYPGATRTAYLKGPVRWQVSYFARVGGSPGERKEIAQVLIDDRAGAVVESWTGHQVAWTMARGYPGAFGRRATALYVWLPLCVVFLVPFVDRRRLLSARNLDLLVLLSFSVSLAFFSHGEVGVSVPLAYPPLLYLLVRMLLVARARARDDPAGEGDGADPGVDGGRALPRLVVPSTWLLVGLIFLVGFRVGLNVVNSNVIDVGYAGVIGADRIVDGEPLYGSFPDNNDHGDTYGPVVYYAYVPFEQVWPWSGRWDDLPAAHGAAVFFDLLTMLLLWLLGRRIQGPSMGVALAYGWAAYPFTLFASSSNSNDSLVAALVVAALLAAASPLGRGVLAALAGLTKFGPVALAPLLALYGARQGGDGRLRLAPVIAFTAAFLATCAAVMAPVLLDPGLRQFFERTIAYQGARDSPFSLWGLLEAPNWAQLAVQGASVLLAIVVAVFPRRRDVISLAALSAAVLIAVQLGVTHWFYLYIVWFFPLVLVVVLGGQVPPPWRSRVTSRLARATEAARSRQPASVG
jgi:hypothetical protein